MASVIGRFESAAALVTATRDARAMGFKSMDAFSPFPVPGLSEALGFRERWLRPIALAMAVVVALGVLFMQWYSSVIAYPYVVGGKPFASWWPFVLPTVALMILAAVLAAFFVMLAANRLPHPHFPAWDWPAFDRASGDGFFLLIDEEESTDRANRFLRGRAAEVRELDAESGERS